MKKYQLFPPLYPGPAGDLPVPPPGQEPAGGIRGFNFSNYVLLGILVGLFRPGFLQGGSPAGKALDNAAILLAATIVFYFLFQRRIFLNKTFFSNFLHIAEFFILGVLLFKENKKVVLALPFFILFVSAFAFELIQVFFHNRVVDANDIWTNVIAGLVGLVVDLLAHSSRIASPSPLRGTHRLLRCSSRDSRPMPTRIAITWPGIGV